MKIFSGNVWYILGLIIALTSCGLLSSDKPDTDKMKECLSNELANKATVISYDQQDGLTREKDGVKYYEGYFNAEIKFVTNYGNYKAGDSYKVIKGTLSFMKTENGWNCQSFDMSAANLVKIKEQGEASDHINASENTTQEVSLPESKNESNVVSENKPEEKSVSASSNNSPAKKYIAVIDDPDGYTNVRAGMSTKAEIIDQLNEGENFEVYPSADNNWWVVYTKSHVKGFVHKSRIRIIN